jgi:hypothetical protein
MAIKMLNLYSIGMDKGLLYETIITTKNEKGLPNAAPIGISCKNESEIVLYLFEGTHTLQNIKSDKRFIVNILKEPKIFVESTLGELSSNFFKKHNDDFYIKNTDVFFSSKVKNIKEVEKKDNLGKSKLSIITAALEEIIIINKNFDPLNRAIFAIIESLVYLSRLNIVDKKTSIEYMARKNEMSKIVSRTGGKSHKEAMKQILLHLNEK